MVKALEFCWTFVVILVLSTSIGCATLDKSECQVANWEIIGFEDAAAGKPSSHIGKHRSACAEYAIAPDLELYLSGHRRGLVQYCTYQNGFNLGNRGSAFNNVCIAQNRANFEKGYRKGQQHYSLRSEINKLKLSIKGHHDHLYSIEQQIKYNEDVIVAGHTSTTERRTLLEEIKGLQLESADIEHEIAIYESQLFNLEEQYGRLVN